MNSQFFGNLRADNLEGKWWRLVNGLGFYSAKFDKTFYAPPRFVTDFASVPRLPLAYWLAGGTGKWEAVIHDMGYRYDFGKRMLDSVFYESGMVRADTRTDKKWTAFRKIRLGLMTGMVQVFGGFAYDPVPGCLDYRQKKTCGRECIACDLYYLLWQTCCVDGYVPDIAQIHEEYTF